MKKLAFLLCFLLLIAFAGCAANEETTENSVVTENNNGAKAFLKGANPDFAENFAE